MPFEYDSNRLSELLGEPVKVRTRGPDPYKPRHTVFEVEKEDGSFTEITYDGDYHDFVNDPNPLT